MQVVFAIMRKTYGYNKKEDYIAHSQIIEMTGIAKGNVSRSLSKMITLKIVIKSDNKLRLNKNYDEWIVIKSDNNNKVIKKETKVIKSDNKKLSKVRDTKDNKETIQKKVLLHNRTWQSYNDQFNVYKFQRVDKAGYRLLSKVNPPRPKKGDMTTEHKWVYLNENNLNELPPDCDINHLDGNKLNNEISNLELLTSSQHKTKHLKQNNFVDKRNKKVQQVIEFAQSKNFSLQGSVKQNRQYAYNLIRKKDSEGNVLGVDRVKWLIEASISLRGKKYSPQVNDFKSLYYKWQDVLTKLQGEKNGKRGIRL